MRSVLVGLACLLAGCTAADPPGSPSAIDGDAAASPAVDGGGDASPLPHSPSDVLRACAQKGGEVRSIGDAVARFNALFPTPDAACFAASLPRPLAVVATSGLTSAQPAGGKDSPRIFFMLPALVVSVVPAGEGAKAIEFGQWVSATRTIKGELGLPILSPLGAAAPFERIAAGSGRTLCGTCHRYEEPSTTVPGGVVSAAFKPELGTFVTVEELRRLHDTCTATGDTSARCAMFHAVFDFGAVEQGSFAREVETFLNPP